jgi:6-phosphogluconolactonase
VSFTDASLTSISQNTSGAAPVFAKTHPNQKLVYVANQQADTISSFAVEEYTGALSPRVYYPTSGGPASLAISSGGGYLYAAGATAVDIFQIESDGTLDNVGIQALALPAAPAASVFTQSTAGTFLNVATGNGSQAAISTFAVDPSTGLLTAVSNVTENGLTFSGLATSTDGGLIYGALQASAAAGQLIPFSVSTDGSLSGQAPIELRSQPGEAVATSGGFLYVATSAGVFGFSGAQTGALSALSGSPFVSGTPVSYLSLDPTQHLLYGSSPSLNQVQGLQIGSDGTLAGGSPFSTGLSSPGHTDFWAITVTGL